MKQVLPRFSLTDALSTGFFLFFFFLSVLHLGTEGCHCTTATMLVLFLGNNRIKNINFDQINELAIYVLRVFQHKTLICSTDCGTELYMS